MPHARLEGPDHIHCNPEDHRLTRERHGPAAILLESRCRPIRQRLDDIDVSCEDAIGVLQSITMKSLTVRLPEALVAEIEAESRGRKVSKSDVIRERLSRPPGPARRRSEPLHAVVDLVGSVDGLPADLSARKKAYLKTTGYGRKRPR